MLAVLAPRLEGLPAATRDRKIIDLCQSAISDLNEASSLEEVLGIRNAAEAFATYTRKWKCAVEAQANTQLVVLLAEARIGAELKTAQERGEIATQERHPGSVRASDTAPAILTDIGIPRQRAAEYKQLAQVGEEAIREEVAVATAENRRPSKARLLKKARSEARQTKPRKRMEEAIPAIAARPPELGQFTLWLRSGATLAAKLESASALAALFRKHSVPIASEEIARVAQFMNDLQGEVP